MEISWRHKEDETISFEGYVTKCVLIEDRINIVFSSNDNGETVQGRFSLLATCSGEQTSSGLWIYPKKPVAAKPISSNSEPANEFSIRAQITGRLIGFKGRKVRFEGIWNEITGDGIETYDFEVNTSVEQHSKGKP